MTGSVPSIALTSISHSCPTAGHAGVSVNPPAHRGTRKPGGVDVTAAWAKLRFINRIMRERRMLASLDENALKDIGLNRADVEREVGRSMLDLPSRRNRWE
jgi:uncharacterized protein YjiS (DUF1127 family)